MPDFTLHAGDSLEILQGFPAETFDSIVTDPPYGLGKEPDALAMLRDWVATGTHKVKGAGFMGREWDSFVPQPALWAECFRVLKPGGHVLAFAGTRTQDLMGLGLRLAGFQIRDTLSWVYGTGFPKSLDVARAIDATDRIGAQRERALRFTAWMRETGLSCQELNALTASNMGSHYLTDREQPQVATEERFAPIREALRARGQEVPEWVEGLVEWRTAVSENLRRREIVGTKKAADLRGVRPVSLAAQGLEGCKPSRQLDITAPHTLEARAWAGWGTALKPGYEPIILARKPLVGTVADNIREHGTGGLNIGACLVGGDRWPANFLHDGSEEVLKCFPDTGAAGAVSGYEPSESTGETFGKYGSRAPSIPRGDSGSAARFFKEVPHSEPELLFCRAKTIFEAWYQTRNASSVGPRFTLSSEAAASALSDAVTWASLGEIALSDSRGLFTTVTERDCASLCETLIATILSFGNERLLALLQGEPTPSGCLVSVVETSRQTGTTTITISLPTSDGFAEPATFNTTRANSALGGLDCGRDRLKYCPKASREDRDEGLDLFPLQAAGGMEGRHDGSLGSITMSRNIHPTVKPTDLMRWLVRLVTRPGGLVLDPFMGSGSTGKAAILEGMRFEGIDLGPENVAIAQARISYIVGRVEGTIPPPGTPDNQLSLF